MRYSLAKRSRSSSTKHNSSPRRNVKQILQDIQTSKFPSFSQLYNNCLGDTLAESKLKLDSKIQDINNEANQCKATQSKLLWEIEREARQQRAQQEHSRLYEDLTFRQMQRNRQSSIDYRKRLSQREYNKRLSEERWELQHLMRKERYEQQRKLIKEKEQQSYHSMMFNLKNRRAKRQRQRDWELDYRQEYNFVKERDQLEYRAKTNQLKRNLQQRRQLAERGYLLQAYEWKVQNSQALRGVVAGR